MTEHKPASELYSEPIGDVIADGQRVPNPDIAWAQFLDDLASGKSDPGLTRATINLTTLLGGFAKFSGTDAQNKAAARYRGLYERAQLGGSKAIDPSIEAVDGGAQNPEAIFEIGADARREWIRVETFLGRMDSARFSFVVIAEKGPTAYAKHWLKQRRPDGAAIARGQVEVRRIADRLSEFMGFQQREARLRGGPPAHDSQQQWE